MIDTEDRMLSYDTPTLTSFVSVGGVDYTMLDTRGNQTIRINGRNFGNDTEALGLVFHSAPFKCAACFIAPER